MDIKRITAVFPESLEDSFERCLRKCGVPGMTIDKVRGFGEHANYFSDDLLKSNIRAVIYVGEQRAGALVEALQEFALEEHTTSGIVVVETVERLIKLHTGADVELGLS